MDRSEPLRHSRTGGYGRAGLFQLVNVGTRVGHRNGDAVGGKHQLATRKFRERGSYPVRHGRDELGMPGKSSLAPNELR